MDSVSSYNLSLKYHRFTPSGCEDIKNCLLLFYPFFVTNIFLGLGASIILNPAKSELFQADTNSLNTTLTTIPG